MESYILTRTMHFGYLKETFGRGAVIQFNPENRRVVIDGRRFDDYRDVEILKRQAMKNPDKPWIIQYSDEALVEMMGGASVPESIPTRAPNSEGLPIVQSDEDSHETIDISHTKVSAINNAKKEAERQRKHTGPLPVVKGDESVEERLGELKQAKDTDLSARAERVRLMGTHKAKMEVVRDDSLGSVGGSASSALNAGTPVGGRRPEETPDTVKQAAEARKSEIDMNRKRVADEMGIDPEQAGIDEVLPLPAETNVEIPVPVVQPEAEMDHSKEARIAALKAELAQLEGADVQEAPEAPKAPKTPKKAVKVPVKEQ